MTQYHAPRLVQEESKAILGHPYVSEAASLFDISPGNNQPIDSDIATRAMARLAWVGQEMDASPDAIFHAMTILEPSLVIPPQSAPPEFA